jgi:hypothetical protein
MPGDRRKAMALGLDGYMEKPINPRHFWQRFAKS